MTNKSGFAHSPLPFCFKVYVMLRISELSPISHRIKARSKRPNWAAEEIKCVASAYRPNQTPDFTAAMWRYTLALTIKKPPSVAENEQHRHSVF